MSASKNSDAVANQGEFSSKVPGSKPLLSGGHQPGKIVSEADAAPEFHAEVLPAGSAPASNTFTPNPDLNNQKMYQDASTTLGGATSADVHTGLGHPGQGQSSKELRDNSNQAQGLTGLGNNEERNDKTLGRDPAFSAQRNLGEDVPAGQRGDVGGSSAQDRIPESADTVASESRS